MDFLEQAVEVNGLHYSYKLWGGQAALPVMALHGWLDNAASFDRLAPRLRSCQIAALDLAGHGLSGHRHAQGSYNLWDDLLDILSLADHLGWQQFILMGHSRGAMIATLLAASMPKRIKALILIDGVTPLPLPAADAPQQLANYLRDNRSLLKKKLPSYQTLEQALEARCRGNGLSETAARQLLARGLESTGSGYQWRSDPKLTTASAFKLTAEHNTAMLAALSMPCKICLASGGFGAYPELDSLLSINQELDIERFEGSHHFHMEETVDGLAVSINRFLELCVI